MTKFDLDSLSYYIPVQKNEQQSSEWMWHQIMKLKKKSAHRKLHHESVNDASEDGDEVEHVPTVFEVALIVIFIWTMRLSLLEMVTLVTCKHDQEVH